MRMQRHGPSWCDITNAQHLFPYHVLHPTLTLRFCISRPSPNPHLNAPAGCPRD